MGSRPSHASHVWLFSFVDVLLVLTFVLSAFTFLVLPQINPKSDPSQSTPPPSVMAVTISWEPGPIDVDLWVAAPGQKIAVGYSHKSGEVWSLLRDDLGTSNDSSPINQENAYARITPPGEYVVNVHCFSCLGPTDVYVEVAMGRSAGSMRMLYKGTITINVKEERTVIRFRLDDKGYVVPGSVNRVFIPLRSAGK
jgi:hypothetical protein